MPPIAADVGSSSPKIADDLTEGGRVTNMDTEVSKVAEGPALTQETHLDTFGVLLEMQWAEINLIDTDGVEHYLNGGFTYLQTNNVQWDIRAGLGLNDRSQDFLCGAGLSVRFH